MTIEQLEAELTRLHDEHKHVRAEKRTVAAALEAKLATRSARQKLAALSEAERAALLEELAREKIVLTQEDVGTIELGQLFPDAGQVIR